MHSQYNPLQPVCGDEERLGGHPVGVRRRRRPLPALRARVAAAEVRTAGPTPSLRDGGGGTRGRISELACGGGGARGWPCSVPARGGRGTREAPRRRDEEELERRRVRRCSGSQGHARRRRCSGSQGRTRG
jgi:hypothetical protein